MSTGWRRWVRPWYVAYGLDGLVLLGVGPILVPLTVDPNGPTAVAAVVAAFYVGALFTPLAGWMADRSGRQKAMFLVCFPLMALTLAAFPRVHDTLAWALLAMVFGGCGAIAGTIGGMFIVEGHPKPEWNQRISWFRVAYGAGQVAGLVLAAVTAHALEAGFTVAAALILLAVVPGRIGVPALQATREVPELDSQTSWRPVAAISWVLHAYHRPSLRGLRGPYATFLLAWLVTMIGVQTFFNVVPLIMRDGFGIDPSISSLLFMVGAGAGVLVFPFAGHLADRIGASRVMAIGIVATLTSFSAMAVVHGIGGALEKPVAAAGLIVAAIAYSLEVVGATMLAARLAPGSQGSAMGAMNSAIAAGAIVGAIAPSFAADALGYGSLPALAAGTLVVALLIALPLIRRQPTLDATAPAPSGP